MLQMHAITSLPPPHALFEFDSVSYRFFAFAYLGMIDCAAVVVEMRAAAYRLRVRVEKSPIHGARCRIRWRADLPAPGDTLSREESAVEFGLPCDLEARFSSLPNCFRS